MDDISEPLVEPFDTILGTFRALLAVGQPKPFPGARQAVRDVCSPENVESLSVHQRSLLTSARSSAFWSAAIDSYWRVSADEEALASEFVAVEAKVLAKEPSPADLDLGAVKVREWESKLRPGALDDMKTVLKRISTNDLKKLIAAPVPTDPEEKKQMKDSSQRGLGLLSCSIRADDILSKNLIKDCQPLLQSVAQSDACDNLLSRANSFSGTTEELPGLQRVLQAAKGVSMDPPTSQCLRKARATCLATIVRLAQANEVSEHTISPFVETMVEIATLLSEAKVGQDCYDPVDHGSTLKVITSGIQVVEAMQSALTGGTASDLIEYKKSKAAWASLVPDSASAAASTIDSDLRASLIAAILSTIATSDPALTTKVGETMAALGQDLHVQGKVPFVYIVSAHGRKHSVG
jgi:hypothetical protein